MYSAGANVNIQIRSTASNVYCTGTIGACNTYITNYRMRWIVKSQYLSLLKKSLRIKDDFLSLQFSESEVTNEPIWELQILAEVG